MDEDKKIVDSLDTEDVEISEASEDGTATGEDTSRPENETGEASVSDTSVEEKAEAPVEATEAPVESDEADKAAEATVEAEETDAPAEEIAKSSEEAPREVSERELLRDNLRLAEDKIDRATASAEDLKKRREKDAARKEKDEAKEREDAIKRLEREEKARESAAAERRAAMDYAENYRRRLREERENNAAAKRREAEREAALNKEREDRERVIEEELNREREEARARSARVSEMLSRVDGVVSAIETPPRVEPTEPVEDKESVATEVSETAAETAESVSEPIAEPVCEPVSDTEPDDFVITVDAEDVGRDILYIEGGTVAEIKIPDPVVPKAEKPLAETEKPVAPVAEKPATEKLVAPAVEKTEEKTDKKEPEAAVTDEPVGAMEIAEELAAETDYAPAEESAEVAPEAPKRTLRVPSMSERIAERRERGSRSETDYDSLREFVKEAPTSDDERDTRTKAASLIAYDLDRDKYTRKVDLEKSGVPQVKRNFDFGGVPVVEDIPDKPKGSSKEDARRLNAEKKKELLRHADGEIAPSYKVKSTDGALDLGIEYPDTDKAPLTSDEQKRIRKEQKREREAELLELAEAHKRAKKTAKNARVTEEPLTDDIPAEEIEEVVDIPVVEEIVEAEPVEIPDVTEEYVEDPDSKAARKRAKKEKLDARAGEEYERELAEKESEEALDKNIGKSVDKDIEREKAELAKKEKKQAKALEKQRKAEQKAAKTAREKNNKRQIKNDGLLIEHRIYSEIRELELERKSAEVSYSSRIEKAKTKHAANKNASSLADARTRMKLAKKYEDADNDRYYSLVNMDLDTVKLPRKANREELKACRDRLVELLRRRDELNIKLIELYSGATRGAKGVAQGRFDAELTAKRKAYKQQMKLARILEGSGVGLDAKKRLYEMMDRHTEIAGAIASIDYSLKKEKPKGRARKELLKQRRELVRERKANLNNIEKLKIKTLKMAKKRERARKSTLVGCVVLLAVIIIAAVVYFSWDYLYPLIMQFISGLGAPT